MCTNVFSSVIVDGQRPNVSTNQANSEKTVCAVDGSCNIIDQNATTSLDSPDLCFPSHSSASCINFPSHSLYAAEKTALVLWKAGLDFGRRVSFPGFLYGIKQEQAQLRELIEYNDRRTV